MDNQDDISSDLISVSHVDFYRGDKKIFDNISLKIPKGKITAIMGPSGTGKTTLLKLIGGQLHPDKGSIIVDGLNIHQLRRTQLFQLRKKMGMLFQSGALLTDINVFDNVALPLREHSKLPESMIRTLVLLKLNAVGLRGAHQLLPSQLSGGMARRVALARAIALDPMMIMYDEPFTGQDPISLGTLVKLIKELNQILEISSIIVSHDVAETCSIADYVYVLSEGKVAGEGTPEQIKNLDSDWVQQFIHGHSDGPVRFHYPAKDIKDDIFQNSTRNR